MRRPAGARAQRACTCTRQSTSNQARSMHALKRRFCCSQAARQARHPPWSTTTCSSAPARPVPSAMATARTASSTAAAPWVASSPSTTTSPAARPVCFDAGTNMSFVRERGGITSCVGSAHARAWPSSQTRETPPLSSVLGNILVCRPTRQAVPRRRLREHKTRRKIFTKWGGCLLLLASPHSRPWGLCARAKTNRVCLTVHTE